MVPVFARRSRCRLLLTRKAIFLILDAWIACTRINGADTLPFYPPHAICIAPRYRYTSACQRRAPPFPRGHRNRLPSPGDLPPPKKHAENTACSCTRPGKCQRTALYMSAQVENSFQIPFEPFPRIEKYPQVAFDMFPQVWKSESGAADSSATHDRHEFAAADFFALHDKHEFCAEIRSLGFWNTNHVCQIHSRRSGKADLTRQIPSTHLWKHKSCAADSFAHVRKRGFSAGDSADGFCAGKFAGTEAPAMVLRR